MDKEFLTELKDLDDKLNIGWNDKKERWQIVRENPCMKFIGYLEDKPILKSFTKLSHILTVQNDDGSYRPLDYRVISWLREADLWRYSRASDFWRQVEEEEDRQAAKQEKQNSEYVQELTKENYSKIYDAIEADSYGRYGGR